MQPLTVLTFTKYFPGYKLDFIALVVQVTPLSKLYSDAGDITFIVPEDTKQEGCVTCKVGVTAVKLGSILTLAVLLQP